MKTDKGAAFLECSCYDTRFVVNSMLSLDKELAACYVWKQ